MIAVYVWPNNDFSLERRNEIAYRARNAVLATLADATEMAMEDAHFIEIGTVWAECGDDFQVWKAIEEHLINAIANFFRFSPNMASATARVAK